MSSRHVKKYVVDASFLLTALLSDNEEVERLFRQILTQDAAAEVLAPEFLKIEIRNGLRFSLPTLAEVQNRLSIFSRLPIQYIGNTEFYLNEAVRLSWQHRTTVYDTLYHVIALNNKATFLTCDKKYYNSAAELQNITLVG